MSFIKNYQKPLKNMDIIKDILLHWLEQIVIIVVPILLVLIFGWIFLGTGHPQGRYGDVGADDEQYFNLQ